MDERKTINIKTNEGKQSTENVIEMIQEAGVEILRKLCD